MSGRGFADKARNEEPQSLRIHIRSLVDIPYWTRRSSVELASIPTRMLTGELKVNKHIVFP